MSTVTPDNLRQIVTDLRDGVSADIWYDAHQHGDVDVAKRIDDTQLAMEQAAGFIEMFTGSGLDTIRALILDWGWEYALKADAPKVAALARRIGGIPENIIKDWED